MSLFTRTPFAGTRHAISLEEKKALAFLILFWAGVLDCILVVSFTCLA